MSFVPFTSALSAEYANLFATCQVLPAKQPGVDDMVSRILANQNRYQTVASALSLPWYFVGTIHSLEASLNFNCHLHNGDPLTARTVHVPAGRPVAGNPPFTWEESALDALAKLAGVIDWSIPGTLYQMEGYNGFGYRTSHPEVLTPYLWSMSNHYTSGKYTADGLFDPQAVSSQTGGAVILRRMAERQIIQFDQSGVPVTAPAVAPTEASIAAFEPLVKYAPTVFSDAAKTLQTALNQFPGTFVLEDGFAGLRTSDAFQRVTGHFLMGDPRLALSATAG
jgi:lysozyme family protein